MPWGEKVKNWQENITPAICGAETQSFFYPASVFHSLPRLMRGHRLLRPKVC